MSRYAKARSIFFDRIRAVWPTDDPPVPLTEVRFPNESAERTPNPDRDDGYGLVRFGEVPAIGDGQGAISKRTKRTIIPKLGLIDLFGVRGRLTGDLVQLGDDLATAFFDLKREASSDGLTILRYDPGDVADVGATEDGAWYQVSVSIPFTIESFIS